MIVDLILIDLPSGIVPLTMRLDVGHSFIFDDFSSIQMQTGGTTLTLYLHCTSQQTHIQTDSVIQFDKLSEMKEGKKNMKLVT